MSKNDVVSQDSNFIKCETTGMKRFEYSTFSIQTILLMKRLF